FNARLDEFVQNTLPEERREYMTYGLLPVNELVTSTLAFVTGGFDITEVLLLAGALVLLIGCLNYSNLVIAQLSLRSQEIGVQKILGSKRSTLILQYCFESFLFVGMAMCLTLVLFFFLLVSFDAAGLVGVGPHMLLDPALWFYLALVMAAIIAIAGAYPAFRTALVPLVTLMRPKGSSGYSGRMRALMVGSQFFISGTLMILALVMFAQNRAMTSELDGDTADPRIMIGTAVSNFTVDPELLQNELKQHPGVLNITQSSNQPWAISNSSSSYFREPNENSIEGEIARHNIGYDYFATTGTRLRGGRDFSRERSNDAFPDFSELTENSGPYAAIIDDQTARTMGWENADQAIGEAIYRRIGPPTIDNVIFVELEIVGAADRPRFDLIDFSNFGVEGNIYHLRPEGAQNMLIQVSRENMNEALVHIDETWRRLMPDVAMQREFTDNIFYETYSIFLTVSFSITALSIAGFFIASIGLLGNATFITNIRQKEVGIRKVMGASSKRLLRMLLLDFAKPILIANAIAFPLGYFIAQGYISLFATRAELTIWPFVISILLSGAIAFAAVFSQSWKS
ncbi:MAG: hypothetical protein MI755_03880, partial [Sphingomonadales bacterium]|nr:hypothetical protein [Sphingomonadales bacterium]